MSNPVFPLLYSRTVRGQVQTWQIEVKGHRYRTTEGLDGGALTTSAWTAAKPKNVGRANQTSASEQAILEAKSRYQKKIDKGYSTDRAAIDSGPFKPMLAKDWTDYGADMPMPVFSSPKMDGVRCIATQHGLFSRNGNAIVSVPHIDAALIPLFEAHSDLILDGELYASKLKHDFNQIISLAKKTKPTAEDLALSAATLEYHVFDLIDRLRPELPFSERFIMLRALDLIHPIVLVPQLIIDSQNGLDTTYDLYLNAGYEGQMVRANTPYENHRTKNLLKRKTMIDAEYLLVDLLPGRGGAAHHAAKAVLKTEAGDLFEAGIIGSHEYAAQILKDKAQYLGKMATVVYQNLTPPPNPVPRFGKLKELDRTDHGS